MPIEPLSEEERADALDALPDWDYDEARDAISRSFTFPDFSAAFAFMTRVALLAEKQDHHPEWTNVWNRVSVSRSTHDAGNTVTDKDRKLADAMDKVFSEMS